MVCFIVSYYINDNIVNFQLFSDKTFFMNRVSLLTGSRMHNPPLYQSNSWYCIITDVESGQIEDEDSDEDDDIQITIGDIKTGGVNLQ